MENLTFTWEPVAYLLTCGLHDLGHQHWLEGVPDKISFPYDPDWEAYDRMEKNNSGRIIAVRWAGHLIGYADVRIFTSMQSKNVTCGYIQEYYITPRFRKKGMCGIKLFRFIEEQLRLMKVQHVAIEERDIVRSDRGGLGNFFRFLRFNTHGKVWSKSLAEA